MLSYPRNFGVVGKGVAAAARSTPTAPSAANPSARPNRVATRFAVAIGSADY